MLKRYLLYLLRWQLSTPILAIALLWLSAMNKWAATIIANLVGGLIFFWVDRFIFTSEVIEPLWEIKENISCAGCGKTSKGFRLVKTANYDRTTDRHPEFRCSICSEKKLSELKRRGIKLSVQNL